jgi:predicted extracellular nuclease
METSSPRSYSAPNRAFSVFFLIVLGFFSAAFGQKEYSIAEIQGAKNLSPHEKEIVRVSGVVTARTKTGFFMQTPDEKADADANTSEGIFVYTKDEPPAEAAIGNAVSITGRVDEFRPRNEPDSLTITEISFFKDKDSIKVISKENVLPKPAILTTADFRSNTVDELERFEGMRVQVNEMLVIAPTDGKVDIKTASAQSDGVFFGVGKGLPRPFREPGLDVFNYIFSTEKEREKLKADHPKLIPFDANPERLRVESMAQENGKAIDVPANTELRNVIGVMHYSHRAYAVEVDANTRPAVANAVRSLALPPPTDRQFSIAGMNLENFFDDEDDPAIKEDVLTPEAFKLRLKKVSMAIRDVLQNPDVIGTVEVEDLATLKRLADRINADAVAAGKPNPKYEAFLIEGNDGRGIDNGFLVKSARVKVLEAKQVGKNDKFKDPNTGEENFLNDRPPLMLRAAVNDPAGGQPFEFTVVVNHLKSFLGYDDPKQMENVRLKKKLQAEFLAKFVQERIKANPAERIMLVGDFNAFQFNDGVMDVVGTIKGKPASKDEVLMASDDLLDPDMVDLVDMIKADQRYSYTYDGNAQAIDHVIVTENLKPYVRGFGYARVNADFPEAYRGDDSRVERYSDHDPAVAYFSFDAPAAKP